MDGVGIWWLRAAREAQVRARRGARVSNCIQALYRVFAVLPFCNLRTVARLPVRGPGSESVEVERR